MAPAGSRPGRRREQMSPNPEPESAAEPQDALDPQIGESAADLGDASINHFGGD